MNTLGQKTEAFFRCYLTNEKGSSQNTIESYSDCLKLFFLFASEQFKVEIDALSLIHLNESVVLNFLNYLEQVRKNSVTTRNQRLAVIKCFFRFLARHQPDFLKTCQKVCDISRKKEEQKVIRSLTKNEIDSIISMPNTSTLSGARDHLMLLLMYSTGARVQEICDLKIADLKTEKPSQVLLTGKGRKERITPIWPEVVTALEHYLNLRESYESEENLFLNNRGLPISRFGVDYIIKKYTAQAANLCSSLKDNVLSPHIIRHTTALHLIQSGVDIVTVKEFLGHKDVTTTMQYVEIDLDMKQKALALCPAPITNSVETKPQWKQASILKFLNSLCKKRKRYVE